jgi:hypothetical protein
MTTPQNHFSGQCPQPGWASRAHDPESVKRLSEKIMRKQKAKMRFGAT